MAGEGEPLVFPQPIGAPAVINGPLTLAPEFIPRFREILPVIPGVDERFVAAAVLKDEAPHDNYTDSELTECAVNLAEAHRELRSRAGVPVAFFDDEKLQIGRTTETSDLYFVAGDEGEDPLAWMPAAGVLKGTVGYASQPRTINVKKAIPDNVLHFEVPLRVFTSLNAEAAQEAGHLFTSSFALLVGEGAVAGFFAGAVDSQVSAGIARRMVEALAEYDFEVPEL